MNTNSSAGRSNWPIVLVVGLGLILCVMLYPRILAARPPDITAVPLTPVVRRTATRPGVINPATTPSRVTTAGTGELKIAALLPISGPAGDIGAAALNGATLAVQQWNARGGVLGKKITLVVQDTQCDAGLAASAATKVIDGDQVRYIIGDVCEQASLPIAEIANARHVIQISPLATHPDLTVDRQGATRPYTYRVSYTDAYQAAAVARFALQTRKARTAIILYNRSSDYSTGLADSFEQAFSRLGGKIAGRDSYLETDTNFAGQLSFILNARVDIIFLPDDYQKVNQILRQTRAMGITTTIVGTDGWDSPDLNRQLALGSYYLKPYSSGDSRPVVQNFLQSYGMQFKGSSGAPQLPGVPAALGYDAAIVLFSAIQQADSADADKVRAVLEAATFKDAVTGPIRFDKQHNPIKPAAVVVVGPNGVNFDTLINP